MVTFIKAQAASLAATIVDFAVTIILVEVFHCWYLAASVIGTISGGVANFVLGRRWVFKATEKGIPIQAIKYLLVWMGNLVLVSGGVYVVTNYGRINYVLSKILVSVVIGATYNYLMQKRFVFK
ncbi:Putative flippase GtrA (transmembrane translocase of bactoprenol-linked glucose) [Hydrobacter penzbergensis]|uniref:Flippase GtrA (Transmembrane translocase of bactoprenol-linked glucose) n=1 Tax=Hydrobacter penzbergensis TaxID=1235997 RepID=A0A8X8IIU6_9BACT|nr:GtrA family protein [Hydrobacter penzbergensis]SDX58507.1 Putative flippase GtrA (transmembrane translocase of bactoprenol-linked glucose) [Hydrobacter penzbergensis]